MAARLPEDEWEEVFDSVVDEWDAWERIVFGFLQSHARGAVYETPGPKMNVTKYKAQIRFMIRLYFCISKFVGFYPTYVRSNASGARPGFPHTDRLGQGAQLGESQEWPRLTDIELLRLQRGLLRYEMFCRLVGLPSIAASCNRDVLYDVITYRSSGSVAAMTWVTNPFSELLPKDEVEEIVCASVYVRDLYHSLRWDLFEDFSNHILDLNQSRGDDVVEKDDSDTRKTAKYWLSQTQGQVLDFRFWHSCDTTNWTESMSRLGLVFLDRMTRSTVAERGELMRCIFNNVLRPGQEHFLWEYWEDIVDKRPTAEGSALELGPHCNSTIRISSRNSETINLIAAYGTANRLRSLGWVFFDDKSKLSSLGLPHCVRASTMHDWVRKEDDRNSSDFPDKPDVADMALDARLTQKEWNELVIEKYSVKDRRGDYRAMSQFVAGARAVVDFRSTQLPHID